MADAPHLVHGVFWDGPAALDPTDDGGAPVLRLQSPSGDIRQLGLHPGARLGFRVAGPGKSCLGHQVVHSSARRSHVLCQAAAPAAKGKQCGRCFVLDESRLMHDFHRGGRVTPGLREYLMQEHWLYVARYVAKADDGRVVRILEDLVTAGLGLTQQVRSAAKTAALLQPRTTAELDAINSRHAAAVRELLAGAGNDGFTVRHESWARPAQAAALYGAAERHAYPYPLDSGGHGFTVAAISGTNVLARLDGTDALFVVGLAQLAGRTIEPGHFASPVPAVQESLF